MPLVKRLIRLGSSRALIIPWEWLEYYEKLGLSVEEVLLELNGEITMRIPTEAERKSFAREAENAEQL